MITMQTHVELCLQYGQDFDEGGEVLVFEESTVSSPAFDVLKKLILETGEHQPNLDCWVLEIPVEAQINYTPSDPGRITGLPENCYPPEWGEFTIDSLIHKPTGIDLGSYLTIADAAEMEVELEYHWNSEREAKAEDYARWNQEECDD